VLLLLALAALVLVLVCALPVRFHVARADRRVEHVLRLVDDELGALSLRLGQAADRAQLARASGVAEGELSLSFPELERDELTGLLNRSGYEADLEREVQIARRTGRPLSLLLLDLHAAAGADQDQLLQELAALLQRLTRASDTVFRRGEDELGILLPETPADGARRFHGRVLDAVAQSPFGRSRPVTFAVGLAEWRANETGEAFDARASAAIGPYVPPATLHPHRPR
jgi:diguanylate cyclase (GGDEF)-like protein